MPIGPLVAGRPVVYNGATDLQSAQITDDGIAAANKDGSVGTPSMRTLGTGAAQACAGNDPRLPTIIGSGSTAILPLSEVTVLTFTPVAGQVYNYAIGFTGSGGAPYIITNATADGADFNAFFRHLGSGTSVGLVINSAFAAARTFNWRVFGWA